MESNSFFFCGSFHSIFLYLDQQEHFAEIYFHRSKHFLYVYSYIYIYICVGVNLLVDTALQN